MALEIVQILAKGTFGHVAVVRDAASGAMYAAKVLKEEHLANQRIVDRLRDEARLLSHLDHPNIVQIAEFRDIGSRPVLLLEWVRGAPLDHLLQRMPRGLPPAETLEMVALASDALHAAWHTVDPVSGRPMHVIHRDIKPSNLLLSVEGDLRMVDFGIAKGQFSGRRSETVSMVLGAHNYLSPERLDGARDAPSGDVYALGCVLYELLTGHKIKLSLHPVRHAERMDKAVMRIRPEGANARIIDALSRLVAAMCAYRPADRPSHAEVVGVLHEIAHGARWVPDLPRLAHDHVRPLLEQKSFLPPRQDPAWVDLEFLQTPTGHTPPGAVPRHTDEMVRAFLESQSWHLEVDRLRRMLATDPAWTATPFLEALDRLLGGPFWKRWRTDDHAHQQLVALLELLQARPGPDVTERARRLVRHRDPEISHLARQLTNA